MYMEKVSRLLGPTQDWIHEKNIRDGGKTVHIFFKYLRRRAWNK
jgi:hypothetical protein